MSYFHIKMMGLILLSVGIFPLHSQQYITLSDEKTEKPIVGAYFEYGSQKGISDETGKITITKSESGTVLYLSHLLYGTWSLTGQQIDQAFSSGVITKDTERLSLQPVTIIALRSDQSFLGQMKLTQMDRVAHDGAAVLNQMAGFSTIRKSGNYGFDPVFRGFKYDRLNIVMNGAQTASAACPNRMDPPSSQISPNMISQVEVLKGPHSLRYGTGFGATLNFIPSELAYSQKMKINGRFTSAYEQNGNVFRNESKLRFSGKDFDASIFGSWSQGDDYKTGNNEEVAADFNRGSFGADFGFRFLTNQILRFSGTYNRARDADFPALPMDLRSDETWLLNARHEINFSNRSLTNWNTTIYASYVDHKMDNLLKPIDPRMVNATTLAQTTNHGGRTEGLFKLKSNTLFVGGDYRMESASGERTREFLMGPNVGNTIIDNAWQDGQISKSALFFELTVPKGKSNLVFSSRSELNNALIGQPQTEFQSVYNETSDTQVNISASIGLTSDITKKSTFGVWLGRAARSGSLTERFINYFPVGQDPYELIGNPNLLPETNHQLDLNYSYLAEKMNVSIDVFASHINDYIFSTIDASLSPRIPSSPGVRRYVNIDAAFKTGLEASWNQSVTSWLSQNLNFSYTYAQNLDENKPLPEIAPMDIRYQLSGQWLEGNLLSTLKLRHVFSQERISEAFGETVTPSFTTVDLEAQFQLYSKLRLVAGVENILDELYYEHLNRSVRGTNDRIFARGRNIYASLNFEF